MDNLTIIIPYRNGQDTIKKLLDSIPPTIPVLVVDDLSEPAYDGEMFVRLDERGYFTGAVNAGIEATKESGTDILVMNQDTWLEGTAWLDQVRDWQRTGYAIAGDGVMKHPAWPNGYVQGTFMYLSRSAIETVGPLNEWDYPLWGSTCEWQLRACRAGFEAYPCEEVKGFRHTREGNFGSSISQALHDEPDKRERFIRTPPAISVIVTCHNYGRYLNDAITSLMGGKTSLGVTAPQSFQSFEVIIVDDASTDGSQRIAQSLVNPWKGIRYVGLPRNVGTAAAVNAGIRASYGKYVIRLDADDMMRARRLEKLYRVAESNPHRFVYDDSTLFANGRPTQVWKMYPEYDLDQVMNKNGIHYSVMFERSAWEEIGGYPEVMNQGREDWAWNVALGARGYCGIHVPEALHFYRREGQNRTLWNSDAEWQRRHVEKMHSLFPRLYSGEIPMCCGRKPKRGSSHPPIASPQTVGASVVDAQLPGSEGMVKMEYVGGRMGPGTYHGNVSRQQYVFGGRHRIKWVDKRDAQGFLALVEDGKRVFRQATAPSKQPNQEAPREQDVLVEITAESAGDTVAKSSVSEQSADDQPPVTEVESTPEHKHETRRRRR